MKLRKAIICDLDGTLADHRHRLHFVDWEYFYEYYPGAKDYFEKCFYQWDDPDSGYELRNKITKKRWKPDWKCFYAEMDKDKVNGWCKGFLLNCANDSGYYSDSRGGPSIIFCTGRPEKYREVTENWLVEVGFERNWFGPSNLHEDRSFLYMRPDFLIHSCFGCRSNQPQYHNPHIKKNTDNRPNHEIKREIYENYIKDKFDVVFCLDDDEKCCEMYKSFGLPVLKVM